MKLDDDKVRLAKLGYETKGEAAFKRIQAKKYIEYIRLSEELSKLSPEERESSDVSELYSKLEAIKASINPLDEEERQYKAILGIYQIDQQMREKRGLNKRPMTQKEVLIAAKYRLKFALSEEYISNDFDINYNTLANLESSMSDEVLKARLNNLNEYSTSLHFKRKRGFKRK